ncbi:hypothetical protein SAMN05216241_107127 [Limimonas halophila]|uniref:Uncharacterized protein n=1 Tax=Limimonas halophila TaxID=1082479 RepID=A0A1G7SRW2_9PROT|nr:zinc ribbon domain-containing protein [Limimonas halophila]SDG25836.1 hypothetical protein SAMN05216241_107127 [Limimonas halophila]
MRRTGEAVFSAEAARKGFEARQRRLSATCSRCGRSRRIADTTADSRPLCGACSAPIPAVHACPGCGTELPGDGNGFCRTCQNMRRRTQRAETRSAEIRQSWVQELYLGLCRSDAIAKQPNNELAIVDRQLETIRRIDGAFTDPGQLSQESLFGVFGAEGLRRAFHAMAYLCDRVGFAWSVEELERLTEERRQDVIVAAAEAAWFHPVLVAYRSQLRSGRPKSLKARTGRLYLRAAADQLAHARDIQRIEDLSQRHVRGYLRGHKGQAASVSAFLGFVERTYGVALHRPRARRSSPEHLDRLAIREVDELLSTTSSSDPLPQRRAKIVRAISRLYGVPVKKLLALRRGDLQTDGNRYILSVAGERIVLTDRLSTALGALIPSDPKGVMFSGKNAHQSMHSTSLRYNLRHAK